MDNEVKIRRDYIDSTKQTLFTSQISILLLVACVHIYFSEFLGWISFFIISAISIGVLYFIYQMTIEKLNMCSLKKQGGLYIFQGLNERFSFSTQEIINIAFSTNATGNVSHARLNTRAGSVNLDMFFLSNTAINSFENFSMLSEIPRAHEFFFHLFLHNLLWIINGFFGILILDELYWANSINHMFYILFAFGVFLLIHRPLNILAKISSTVDIALGLLGIFTFFFYFIIVIVVPRVSFEDDIMVPCAKMSPQIQCYNVSEDLCKGVWKNVVDSCNYELADEVAHKGPTSLTGPIYKRCRNEKFDKALRYNRKNATNSSCSEHFSSIKF